MEYGGCAQFSLNELKEEDEIELRSALTAQPLKNPQWPSPEPFPIYRESNQFLYAPRFYEPPEKSSIRDVYKSGISRSTKGTIINHDVDFDGKLNGMQTRATNTVIDRLKTNNGCIMSIYCGGGKTVCALYCISKLRRKTLVIVHKEFLMNQWMERIREFLPNAKIGKIQQNIVDIEGKDVVVAMLQSLSLKDYPPKFFSSFGFAIFDECHHISARVFSQVMFIIPSFHVLGLSATPERKDGLSWVLKLYYILFKFYYREWGKRRNISQIIIGTTGNFGFLMKVCNQMPY